MKNLGCMPLNAATNAARFSARCVSRDGVTPESGAGGNAEAMEIGERSARADDHVSTKRSATGTRPSGGRTLRGRKHSGEESDVTENPPLSLVFPMDQRRKIRLSRTTPLPHLFRPGKRGFAKAGARAVKRWRRLHISRCSLIRDSDLEKKWQTFSNSGESHGHAERKSPPRFASLSMP